MALDSEDGLIDIPCSECHGEGILHTGVECTNCNGEGRVLARIDP